MRGPWLFLLLALNVFCEFRLCFWLELINFGFCNRMYAVFSRNIWHLSNFVWTERVDFGRYVQYTVYPKMSTWFCPASFCLRHSQFLWIHVTHFSTYTVMIMSSDGTTNTTSVFTFLNFDFASRSIILAVIYIVMRTLELYKKNIDTIILTHCARGFIYGKHTFFNIKFEHIPWFTWVEFDGFKRKYLYLTIGTCFWSQKYLHI